ncbi:putative cytochrome p450 oxidoreductase protein [Botrytis fragariae]|uniref:Putative cytochrome p450 oxidoreductase protein n=1 Tax=Botrytis fragariae TaxID=1964551 RepID=A0A8H6EGE8_9HELO|nr:putative cytochrome p450 oxidoreductase protein [Botrytis fragariae]KAF5871337.1 putative cytochrome p450 oxidoreductase protein [Botrytis fragariae]
MWGGGGFVNYYELVILLKKLSSKFSYTISLIKISPVIIDKSKDTMPSTLVLGASAVLLLAYVIRAILFRPRNLDFPIVGNSNDADFRAALLEGTAKYPTTPYILPSSPPTVVLPLNMHDELRNLPENKASFQKELSRIFYGEQTGLGKDTLPIIKVVKTDLNRHVASTIQPLQDESRFALDKEFGMCENWTQLIVYEKILKMIALLSGRVFVGRPLSRTEEWINISSHFTEDVVLARESVAKYPAWLRSFALPFLPEIRKVKHHKVVGAELLRPIIEGCIQRFREGKGGDEGDEFDDDQGTFVSWVMKWSDEKKKEDPFALAQHQLILSFAAMHTTAMAVTHALFDLAAHPQFIGPLREEIDQVLADDGWEDDGSGIKNLKKQSLPKLKKLDSLLKESQRLSPLDLVFNIRSTTSPIRLSTGETIPTGTRITFDAHTINMSGPNISSLPHDPSSIPALDSPEIFSPFRWSTLREAPGNESKYQYVTTSKESVNFGHGNHACPGRFFAATEIKVLMVEILKGWDFRLVGDEEGKGERDRGIISLM